MTSSFSNLMLAEPLARAVAEMGYTAMTPIQAQAIPVVLTGQDVMGAAQTGTGKTAAFSLPLLQRLLRHESSSASPARHPVRALVLLPTRELADQVARQIALYARHTKLRSTVVFGGIDMKPQTLELKKGVEVLVATPGRLLDHIEAKNAVLNQVEYVVLDEADRMLDIGFLPDLQRILSYLPKERTTLLFSATFSPEIRRLASSYLHQPVTIEVARPNATAATVEQRFYSANDDDKRRAIHQVLRTRGLKQAFIFVNSKLGCARLARSLEREGLRTAALHGDRSQDERLKALQAFKSGDVDLLVCTDVAARGLDIKDVPAVFNFDVPFNAEDYVHRIGRTGRAGASGLAVTLVSGSDARLVADIEKLIGKKTDLEAIEYDEDRPRGRINDGRRAWRKDDETGHPCDTASPATRERREPYRGMSAAQAAQDPFFAKPYEPDSAAAAAPSAWESVARPPVRGSLSANIKPKRHLAALFKAAPPESPAP
ncbi:DEAD/DEAH box helicase [Verminephrobacter eiseniae]|uniref:DEAD/DEAH box helicase n=1 Tax=Verminephrobacter eiseniae TaxID=364317 RepID=UPI002237CD1D|nr:DEAD/DEAH box helicase [Verminephrobacter eiseniae]MCW5234178.1 DEAD/DEAH box helicase [Verminephrobacter eiseniae]MCW5294266.1 DEAD/DEAH box helicase [Verminephrobacter eiseniae]MCW8187305.1 DEAD/DEAH box helicase [Verminephrobacter eiseniae]MCW8225739.1 DEAD/DEAH box helicase [Verminephrobacter eiseniae]MCW8236699.1 DEAD/DEAH box helicase [Verminephrobacter eiseniae]